MGRAASSCCSWGERVTRRASAILRAISSCTSKTSAISRSYRSDQTGKSVFASMSWVLMRRRVPARRRLPPRTKAAFSSRPTCWAVTALSR